MSRRNFRVTPTSTVTNPPNHQVQQSFSEGLHNCAVWPKRGKPASGFLEFFREFDKQTSAPTLCPSRPSHKKSHCGLSSTQASFRVKICQWSSLSNLCDLNNLWFSKRTLPKNWRTKKQVLQDPKWVAGDSLCAYSEDFLKGLGVPSFRYVLSYAETTKVYSETRHDDPSRTKKGRLPKWSRNHWISRQRSKDQGTEQCQLIVVYGSCING